MDIQPDQAPDPKYREVFIFVPAAELPLPGWQRVEHRIALRRVLVLLTHREPEPSAASDRVSEAEVLKACGEAKRQ